MNFSELSGNIPVIDSHVHAFPEPVFEAVKKWFSAHAWEFHAKGAILDLIRAPFNQGVTGMVLMNYAHRPGIADYLNQFTGCLLKEIPNSVGLAAVHPEDDNPREIIKRAFNDYGLCGVKMHCHVQKTPPDSPSWYPIYEAVLEMDGIMNIHAGREPAIDAYGLDVHTISGADRVERVLSRYPELKLIIPHLGYDEPDRFYGMLDVYPNLRLDTTMMLGGFFGVEIDRRKLIEYADRIFYGSDYPHIPYEAVTEVGSLMAMELGEEASRKILYENAAAFFPFPEKD